MSSLHTKYRPANFKQIVGHEDIIPGLQKTVQANRAHTFLFHGPAGLGKTSLARIVANEMCGGQATAANIEEIPAALFTGVESMRGVADKARFKAIGASNNKVIILDEAHRLSAAAWDALLKLTEEPPAHMYFMFCTTNAGKVPKTILQRCYSVELKPLTEDEITKVLKRVIKKEELDVAADVVEAIADCAGGSPRQALQFLEQCQYCESAGDARKIMKQGGESKEIVDLARFLISKQGRDWPTAQRLLVALKEDNEAESVRIVLCNYFAAVLLGTKSAKDAGRLMGILDCFSQPYFPSEKFAPLLLSVGAALGLGE